MLVLIKNEIIKLLSRIKTLVVVIGFILFTALLVFGLYRNQQQMKMYDSPDYQINNMKQNIEYNKNAKNNIPKDIENDQKKIEEYKKSMDQSISSMEEELKQLESSKDKKLSWRDELKNNINQLEQSIKNDIGINAEAKTSMQLQLDQLKYLQKNDIQPMKDYELNSINFINNIAQILGVIFLAVGLAVFVSDMVSGECTPPTLKVLLTQPVSRGKVLLSKFISVNIVGIALIILIEIIYFVAVGLIFGFGDLNYPMMVGAKYKYAAVNMLQDNGSRLQLVEGSTHMIVAWKYILELFGIQIIYIIACISFAFVLSTILKSSMVSMATSTVVLIAAIILFQSIKSLRRVAQLSFTSFGDIGSLLNGRIAEQYQNPSINLAYALIIFGVWTVVCYIVSHIVFTKKDILI